MGHEADGELAMTGEKDVASHEPAIGETQPDLRSTAATQAPAEMPGVEAVARLLCKLDGLNPDLPRSWVDEELLWTEWREPAEQVIALFAPILAEKERLTKEREALVMMAGGGLRSLAAMMKHTFAGRGVEITDEEADRAARQASELIVHSAMAGNPKEWCLSCGTVSGDGQCHCTEPFAASDCNRQARHHLSEMASEAQAAVARALAAEAALKLVAEQDVTEIALDPDWPRRICAAAIRAEGE